MNIGGIEKQRLYLDGSPYTAFIISKKTGSDPPQTNYLHRDYLGSITQISDNSGNLAAEYSYDAWGRMRNPANWQVYAQGSQPTMPYGGRGYTGHEQLNQFGIINMNARLYDPLLARFLAPDPYVGSGMANDFNRYIYCQNNPLMFTDPSGESWKSFWSDFGNAFVRDFKRTFISGRPGFEMGYNSMGGGFINATYNGRAIGPSAGINNSGGITTGNTINGFHQMRSISPQIDQAAMQMYQANNELQQIRNNQENWKQGMTNASINPSHGIVYFFENRYQTWGDFIYSPEVGYGFTYLSKGLKLPKGVNVAYNLTSYGYPIYKSSVDTYNSYDPNYINYYSRSEATYDLGATTVSSVASFFYGPEAGFGTAISFEIVKSEYKYVYHEIEQRVIPQMVKFNQDMNNLCNPEFWINPSALYKK